jgi:hypothetical protein
MFIIIIIIIKVTKTFRNFFGIVSGRLKAGKNEESKHFWFLHFSTGRN